MTRRASGFLPLDPEDEEHAGQGRELGRHNDPSVAVDLAEQITDAVAGRWVNFGVVGEEYADFVRCACAVVMPPTWC